MKQFNKVAFDGMFNVKLNDLRGAERVTKAVLMDLSRQVWEAFHHSEDVDYINRILDVLSPVNKRVAVEFFTEFSGFNYSEKDGKFTRKDKKEYEAKKAKLLAWLEDPLNNIWSWAARELKIEKKEFDLSGSVSQLMKKAEKNQFTKTDIIKAMLASGLSLGELAEFMQAAIAEA